MKGKDDINANGGNITISNANGAVSFSGNSKIVGVTSKDTITLEGTPASGTTTYTYAATEDIVGSAKGIKIAENWHVKILNTANAEELFLAPHSSVTILSSNVVYENPTDNDMIIDLTGANVEYTITK